MRIENRRGNLRGGVGGSSHKRSLQSRWTIRTKMHRRHDTGEKNARGRDRGPRDVMKMLGLAQAATICRGRKTGVAARTLVLGVIESANNGRWLRCNRHK